MELSFEHSHDILASHVMACLNTIKVCTDAIGENELESNVQTSLEATAIRACNRLDALLDDSKRWLLPESDPQPFAAAYAKAQIDQAQVPTIALQDLMQGFAEHETQGPAKRKATNKRRKK